MSALPKFTIKELLDAGIHFGHKTSRWNPLMEPYLFGSRNGIHIIDLQKTAPLLHNALNQVYNVVRNNGRVLFVGTKKQASESVAESAKRCGQYFVNFRWLGGMLTNWNTVSKSIQRLCELEQRLSDETEGLTKKEILDLSRKRDKLQLSLGGIMDMGGKPDLIFVIDTNKETIAIAEAKKLGIPVLGIVDSNSNPDSVDFPIPGNDDATRAIRLYCKLVSDAVLAGIQDSLVDSGVDLGESADLPEEILAKKVGNDNKQVKVKSKSSPAKEEVKKEKKEASTTATKADNKKEEPKTKTEEKPKVKAAAKPKAEKTEKKEAPKKAAKTTTAAKADSKKEEPKAKAAAKPKAATPAAKAKETKK